MLYPIAKLDAGEIKAVMDLEAEIGSPIVALSSIEAVSATLSDDKLKKLRALEDELDVVLLAFKPS